MDKTKETEEACSVEDFIASLLEAQNYKQEKSVPMKEVDIFSIVRQARTIFMKEHVTLEISAPLKVCGDIHGQYYDLLKLFKLGGFPPDSSYLFLGDYVDRGKQSLETICLLLAYKVAYPDKFFLLRGNHEASSINKLYGFYDECKRRFSVKLWKLFSDCFNAMPIAAVIDKKILCMHGGLSPEMKKVEDLDRIFKPIEIPDTGLLCDIVWSDPDKEAKGWIRNSRGVSFAFGKSVLAAFLKKNKLDLVCRAHQVVEDGYEFFGRRQLVTIFSAPNYCGEFDNNGALMTINKELMCSFQILKAKSKEEMRRLKKLQIAKDAKKKKAMKSKSKGKAKTKAK